MNKRLWFAVGLFVVCFAGGFAWQKVREGKTPPPTPTSQPARQPLTGVPQLETAIMADGLSNVWDMALLEDEKLLVTERNGEISLIDGGLKKVLLRVPGVVARGEGGLMGMTLDASFAANRYVYACYNTANDIRLSRWQMNEELTSLEDKTDIITGMPVTTGRHSGCRPRFGADGYLWVGTGDVADGRNPQDPKSLGGKILRIDRDGKGVTGNLPSPFDNRIYSYGHRNVQGMAMLPVAENGNFGYSVEHGTSRDDEVNALVPGNFGWDPVPGYNESVAMTDTRKYPQAIEAVWSSGSPTIAPSGASILMGEKWRDWQGAIAVAVLKGQHLRILQLNDGKLVKETVLFEREYGRLRSANLESDGSLYLTTDNGRGQDKVIRIWPK